MRGNDVNAAVQQNLDRILADERQITVLRIAQIRVGGALIATAVMLTQWDQPVSRPSLFGAAAFLVLAVALLLVLQRWPQKASLVAYATPLLDAPLLAYIQYRQQILLAPEGWMGIPNNMGFMMALIASATLTLSRPAVLLTAGVALISNQLTFENAGLALPPRALATIPPVMAALVGIALMDRLRTMVHAS